jgi:hypothetical protein
MFNAGLLTIALLGPASADIIDFESGFSDQQSVTQVITATNTVTFSVGPNHTPAYIAQVGLPTTAFVLKDTPADMSISGSFFLTDEKNGPIVKLPYYLSFATPVLNLSLDLYDYRAIDGGARVGDSATLTAYDQNTNVVGTDVFTIKNLFIVNGNDAFLAITLPTGPIWSASLTFSRGDVGTGIDNIAFNEPPPPSGPLPPSLLLMVSGLGLVALYRRRSSL